MKPLKPKKCRACPDTFTPRSSLQVVCSPLCAIEYDRQKKIKKADKAHTKAKRDFRLSDRPLQKKLTQALINKFVRLRDGSEPCISCGRHHTGQYHAGHYLSVGSHPHMRYNARNIHKQCSTCNNHLSGNLIEYRKGLIDRYGVEFVESLEADQAPRQFSNEDVISIGRYYKNYVNTLLA